VIWLVTFYNTRKDVQDTLLVDGTRSQARRAAAETYLRNADRHGWAGFLVVEEKHGGY
jgi:hypothetical protein